MARHRITAPFCDEGQTTMPLTRLRAWMSRTTSRRLYDLCRPWHYAGTRQIEEYGGLRTYQVWTSRRPRSRQTVTLGVRLIGRRYRIIILRRLPRGAGVATCS